MPLIKGRPNTRKDLDRFNRAPPGISLASPPGKMPFENPAVYSSPDEAVDAIIDNLERPETEEKFIQLMAAGISIEELVDTLVFTGFAEGQFSVDIAEIIKAPLGYYLMGLAAAADVPAKPFRGKTGLPPETETLDDETLLNIMQVRNPSMAKFMMRKPEYEAREKEALRQRLAGSFLGVEAPAVMEGEYSEVQDEMEDQGPEEEMNG